MRRGATGLLLVPGRRPGAGRRGFSLIELLINVAIISALVGMAVPLFQGYVLEAQRSKIGADLEIITRAIQRFEQNRGAKLSGTSLKPLLGGFLSQLPVDPWGNEYVVDGNLGVMGTLGADQMLYGEGSDQDVLLVYNAWLVPIKAYYEGPFGPPRLGNRVVIHTSKVFGILPDMGPQVANDIVVVRKFGEVPFVPLGLLGFTLDWGRTRPNDGVMVLVCSNPSKNTYRIPITSNDLINFSPMVISFSERPAPDGPFARDPGNWVVGPRPVGGDILGVTIGRLH